MAISPQTRFQILSNGKSWTTDDKLTTSRLTLYAEGRFVPTAMLLCWTQRQKTKAQVSTPLKLWKIKLVFLGFLEGIKSGGGKVGVVFF